MAGSGNYQICLRSLGVGNLVTIDIDPSRAQYNPVKPSDSDQDGVPIFQGKDDVVWEFDYVTSALGANLRNHEGFEVWIRTRLADDYNFGNRKAIFHQFITRSKSGRRWLTGRAIFVNVGT